MDQNASHDQLTLKADHDVQSETQNQLLSSALTQSEETLESREGKSTEDSQHISSRRSSLFRILRLPYKRRRRKQLADNEHDRNSGSDVTNVDAGLSKDSSDCPFVNYKSDDSCSSRLSSSRFLIDHLSSEKGGVCMSMLQKLAFVSKQTDARL